MRCDPRSARKKRRPAWCGPFVVTGYGERSYTLMQKFSGAEKIAHGNSGVPGAVYRL